MFYRIIARGLHWLCRFLYVQCFLMFVSLPIVLCWGLPISLYSALGNLLFGPLIALFLSVSGLLFFCHLFHIPSLYIAQCLEYSTWAWKYFLSYGRQEWLIGLVQPPLLVVGVLPVCAFGLLIVLAAYPLWRKTLIMSASFIGICTVLHFISPHVDSLITVPCNKGNLTLILQKGELCMIDPGLLGQQKSIVSWIHYTCVPYLIRTTGFTSIDHLVLLHVNRTTLKGVVALTQKIRIRNLYVPCQVYDLEPECMKSIHASPVQVIPLDDIPVLVGSAENCVGRLQPLEEKKIQKKSARHTRFVFHSTIDKHSVTIYPSCWTKRNKDV